MACTHLQFAYSTQPFSLLFQHSSQLETTSPGYTHRLDNTPMHTHTPTYTPTEIFQVHLSPDLLQPQLVHPRALPERRSPSQASGRARDAPGATKLGAKGAKAGGKHRR